MDDAIASDASRQAQFLSEIASQGINLSLDLLQRAGGLYAIQTSSTIDGRPYYVRRHGDSAFIMCATPSHHREYARIPRTCVLPFQTIAGTILAGRGE